MKKKLCLVIIIAIAISLMSPAISFADSPITSTKFYTAYLDIDVVAKASEMTNIDSETIKYLSDPEYPLDIKAAVINAIGWEIEGKDNAARYADFIFEKSLDDLDLDAVPAHDLFCIGYLMVMDKYFEPERAIPVLEKACEAFPASFTAAMITALAKAQAAVMNADEWGKAWTLVEDVIQNENLELDMRQEAVDIILDYMALYKDYARQQQDTSPDYILDKPVTVIKDNSYQITISFSSPVTDKPITLTYFRIMPDDTDEIHYANFYNELRKRTNVKLSFIDVPEDVMLQKLNIMAAAGDTPDLIEFPWQRYPGFAEKMAEMDIIIEMDELINEAAPNLCEILELVPQVKNMIISDYDGHIYQIPGIDLRGGIVNTGPVIRGDLLKKYGLSVPKTIDEWETMLTVFRDNEDGIVPLSFDLSVLENSSAFIGAFGIPFGFGVRDGKVFYGPVEESYKDFAAVFSRWYEKGLIDPEFLVLNDSQLKEKVNSGKIGAFIVDAESLKESIDALKSIDASIELIPVQYPIMQNYNTLNVFPCTPAITEYGIAISSRNNYPAESMKWIDYAYSEEGYRLFNFGIEEPAFEPVIKLKNAGSGNLPKLPDVPGYKADTCITGYDYQEQKTSVRLWSAPAGGNNPSVMPPVSLTREEDGKLSAAMESVTFLIKEAFARFVVGDLPSDDFNWCIEKAKYPVDHAVEIMQAAFDRYNNLHSAKLRVNGKNIETDTKPCVFIEGEMLVPIRFVIEGLGGSVAWNDKNKIVTGIWNDTVITMKLNSKEVIVDYEPKTANTEITAINKRTYVPASFIQEVFGVTVQWNEKTRVVNIISN